MQNQFMHPADQLVMFMQRIYDRGLTTTSGGNLSILDDDGNIWITPAGIDKGTLTRKDIICVKPDGTVIGPHKPSSELPFHASVYRNRKDIRAVLHAHPPALVAFSIARVLPDIDLVPDFKSICKKVSIATYAVPGSQILGDNISKEFDKGINTVILENHGVCIGDVSLYEAYKKFETLNFCATLEMCAKRLGKKKTVASDFLEKNSDLFNIAMPEFEPEKRSAEEMEMRRELTLLVRRSYKQGLFSATNGTYSVKLSDGSVLVTPHGFDRAFVSEEDFVLVKDGKREKGKVPSASIKFHLDVYKNNPEVNSLLLAKPVYAMAFAVTGEVIDSRTIPESYILLRDVIRLPKEALYKDSEKASKEFKVSKPIMIFDNDSVAVTASNPLQAFDRLEVLELTAHSIIDVLNVGDIVHISDSEINDIKVAFNLPD